MPIRNFKGAIGTRRSLIEGAAIAGGGIYASHLVEPDPDPEPDPEPDPDPEQDPPPEEEPAEGE